jgi:hypothetical protein
VVDEHFVMLCRTTFIYRTFRKMYFRSSLSLYGVVPQYRLCLSALGLQRRQTQTHLRRGHGTCDRSSSSLWLWVEVAFVSVTVDHLARQKSNVLAQSWPHGELVIYRSQATTGIRCIARRRDTTHGETHSRSSRNDSELHVPAA